MPDSPFITAEKYRTKSRIQSVKDMDSEDIEDLLIFPAQRMIEEEFNLDLDTDAEPRHWAGTFERQPHKLVEFNEDMRRAITLLADRLGINPNQYAAQGVRGASATYGPRIPGEVRSLLRRWGKPNRIFRT